MAAEPGKAIAPIKGSARGAAGHLALEVGNFRLAPAGFRTSLDDMSFEPLHKRTLCLEGPSFRGKPKMRRHIAGLLPPSKGKGPLQGTNILVLRMTKPLLSRPIPKPSWRAVAARRACLVRSSVVYRKDNGGKRIFSKPSAADALQFINQFCRA